MSTATFVSIHDMEAQLSTGEVFLVVVCVVFFLVNNGKSCIDGDDDVAVNESNATDDNGKVNS